MPDKLSNPIQISLLGLKTAVFDANAPEPAPEDTLMKLNWRMTDLLAFQAPLISRNPMIEASLAQVTGFLYSLFDGKLFVK